MPLTIDLAEARDAAAIQGLRAAVADHLTRAFGRGHWSSVGTVRGIERALETSRVIVARDGDTIVGLLRLQTKKPWAIDPAYFRTVKRPLYLTDMAVAPERQGSGIGRRLIAAATSAAKAWPADAVRLDAYDTAAGAGDFYAKCGFREVGRVIYRDVPLIYFELVL